MPLSWDFSHIRPVSQAPNKSSENILCVHRLPGGRKVVFVAYELSDILRAVYIARLSAGETVIS